MDYLKQKGAPAVIAGVIICVILLWSINSTINKNPKVKDSLKKGVMWALGGGALGFIAVKGYQMKQSGISMTSPS